MQYAKPNIIQASETASKAMSMLERSGTGVLVFEGKKYVGMIDERQVASHAVDPSKMKAGKMAVSTPVLAPNDELLAMCQSFFAGRFKTLPVMEKDKCLGTISRWDLLDALSQEGFLTGHKVSEFMTSPILTIDAAAPVSAAHATMRTANVRRLAVVENGRLAGVVSVFDLLKARSKPRGRLPEMRHHPPDENQPVSSFMKSEVHTVEPGESLANAVASMLDKQMAGLIVAEGRRPVGILTFKDLLESVMRKEAQLPVFVSGLHEQQEMASDVAEEAQKLLAKLGGSIGAESISIHVKKTGAQFAVSASVKGRSTLRAHYSDFTLMDAVKGSLDELKTQALKAKKTGMGRRDNF